MFGTRNIIFWAIQSLPALYYAYQNNSIFEGKMNDIAADFFDNAFYVIIAIIAFCFLMVSALITVRCMRTP